MSGKIEFPNQQASLLSALPLPIEHVLLFERSKCVAQNSTFDFWLSPPADRGAPREDLSLFL